jgi:hypothetical protein
METGGMDDNTLFFACTIQTTIPFLSIKGRTINEFRRHNTFLKIHRGGFKYGVNWSPLGFFIKHHPSFVNETIKSNLIPERLPDNTNDSPGNDGSITDTTFIQQAINTALKKAYYEHRREIKALQQQFLKQLELIKQNQNTASLENKFDEKFDKLMNMMMMMNASNTNKNPSPLRKKGRPTNLKENFSQNETPKGSNLPDSNHQHHHDNESDMVDDDSNQQNIHGPHFNECPKYIAANQTQTDEHKMDVSCKSENSNKDGDWITPKERNKDRKDKPINNPYINSNWPRPKTKPMTPQKLSNLIGQHQGTPPRTGRGGYGRSYRGTPPRSGRSNHAPRPVQAEKATGVNC